MHLTMLICIKNLKLHFYTYEGVVEALDGIDLEIMKGEILGLVGETGCGKSVTAQSILQIVSVPPGRIEDGQVLFFTREACPHCESAKCSACRGTGKMVKNGTLEKCGECGGDGQCPKCFGTGKKHLDILKLGSKALQEIRGDKISYISQEKMSALNPVLTIGRQISESFLLHQKKELYRYAIANLKRLRRNSSAKTMIYRLHERLLEFQLKNLKALEKAKLRSKFYSFVINLFRRVPVLGRYETWIWREARIKSVAMLSTVKMPKPEEVFDRYPHELSGGMQQRVLIAMALACKPDLLIADEPTTGLDVTIQAQILELMKDLQNETNSSILLITHDLGIVAENCDRLAVMYAGVIVEKGDLKTVFRNPLHPYTIGLLSTIPKIHQKKEYLNVIPGIVPILINPPKGCRFHPRCSFAMVTCKEKKPIMLKQEDGHFVACHRLEKQPRGVD